MFEKVYLQKRYKERTIYDLTTFAFQALEEFLALEEFRKNKHKKLVELTDAYQKRGLFTYSKKAITKLEQNLKKQVIKNSSYHFHYYQFKYNAYLQHHHLQQQRNAPVFLQEVTNSLDTAYIAEKLKQACFMIAHQAMYNTNYSTGLLPFIINYIQEAPKILEIPAVAVYYYCYQLLTQPSATSFFQEFKQLLSVHIHLFPTQEIKDFILIGDQFLHKSLQQWTRTVF